MKDFKFFWRINTLCKEASLGGCTVSIEENLKEIKKSSSIPIITKVAKNYYYPLLELDIQSTKAYSLLNDKVNPLSDYLLSPIIK